MRTLIARFRAYLRKIKDDFVNDQSEFLVEYKKDKKKLPNRITLWRLSAIPILGCLLIISPNNFIARSITFVILAAVLSTDKLDGYIARKKDLVTDLGKFLDPTVDKAVVTITLVSLIIINNQISLRLIMLAIIVCDLSVIWLSFIAKHRNTTINVTGFGKFKMVVQCAALLLLVQPIQLGEIDYLVILSITFIVTLCSLIIYIIKFFCNNSK